MISKLWILPCSLIGYLVMLFLVKENDLTYRGAYFKLTRRMFPWADAITFGDVVLVRNGKLCKQTINHETTHVQQYQKWGVLFFAIYLGSFLYNLVIYRNLEDAYWYIPFEVQARAAENEA